MIKFNETDDRYINITAKKKNDTYILLSFHNNGYNDMGRYYTKQEENKS